MHKQIVKTLYLSDKVYKQKTFVSLADLITLAFTLFSCMSFVRFGFVLNACLACPSQS